jgi:transposase
MSQSGATLNQWVGNEAIHRREARSQATLLPEYLDDYVAEDNPVRAVDAFVEELDLKALGFEGADPAETGRPSYHPAVLLKLYIYGYLNRIPSSRRLEREAQRNVELMWLTGRLAPDFKTIAGFRRENGVGIRNVCRRFVELCRELKLFSQAIVAIDSSKFKAVNSRDRNFTPGRSTSASSRSSRGSSATWRRSRPPTAPSQLRSRPRPSDCRRRSRRCASRCGGWRRCARN